MKGLRLLLSKLYRIFVPIALVDMYRKMGVKIGKGTKIQFDVVMDYSHYWLIEIGNHVTIAPRVHILAHDASTKNHMGYTRIDKVVVKDNVFIGAGSIILPGVTIGANSIIGAGSIVSKSVPDNVVAVGNPCKVVCSLEEYLMRQKELMSSRPKFDESYTLRGPLGKDKIDDMLAKMADGPGFVE